MKKVITYGTYDLLHYGHIRLLERAKQLGDYLIVAVTADDFDKRRGKINVNQSLMERIEAVRATGLADEIIVEEYEGQKIDDIKRYGIDIFTVGSDWIGKFDYLKEFCEVVYLDRTEGVSSTQIRSKNRTLKMGIVGNSNLAKKYITESKFVNGLEVVSVFADNDKLAELGKNEKMNIYDDYDKFLSNIDAVYIASDPKTRFDYIEKALKNKKHVLCETPIYVNSEKCSNLFELASKNEVILMDAIKTAYSTAFNRLVLLVKSGLIGNVVSVDATCTSMEEYLNNSKESMLKKQDSISAWGPNALLPVFTLLGTNYEKIHFSSYFLDDDKFDLFTKIDFKYKNAVASVKIGKGVKSEGELVISGTKGYIYVPAPWWKTDYFEARFESQSDTKRYFYQLDGEGIRYELVTFVKSIESKKQLSYIDLNVSEAIALVIEKFYNKENLDQIIVDSE